MLARPNWKQESAPGTGPVAAQRPLAPQLGATDASHQLELPHLNLSLFWTVLVERRTIVAVVTAVALICAVIYLLLATAQFSASALLLIDTKNSAMFRASSIVADAAVESANIESQVEILKSERILQKVVLDQNLRDAPVLAPGAISTGLAWLTQHILFWRHPPDPIPGEDPKIIASARALQKLIGVRRVGTTYLIEVSAQMSSPAQAASVTNSIAKNYIADQQSFREDLARRQSSMLQARSDELEAHATQAEEAVEQLKFSGSMKGETSASARVELKNLESTAQTYRVLHDKFLEQSAESWQQQFLSLPDATVASPAYAPLGKSSPQTLVVLTSSLLLGLSAGVIIVLLLNRRTLGLAAMPTYA